MKKAFLFFALFFMVGGIVCGADYPTDIASGKPLSAAYLSNVRLARVGHFKPIGTTLNYVNNLFDLGGSGNRWRVGYFGSLSTTTPLSVANGGTGASTEEGARVAISVYRTVAHALIEFQNYSYQSGFSSITRIAAGKWTFTFSTAQPDRNYIITLTGSACSDSGNTSLGYPDPKIRYKTTAGFEVWCHSYNDQNIYDATFIDIKVDRRL